MIRATFRSLEKWPRKETPHSDRKSRYHFKAGYSDTLQNLEHEILQLGGRDVVIQKVTTHGPKVVPNKSKGGA